MENSVEATTRAEVLAELGKVYTDLARAQRRLRGRDATQPGRLTAPQVNLLLPLLENGPMSSGHLAEAAGLTAATTTHMLDQLAVVGVVERNRLEDDKRVVITGLTEEGREMVDGRREEMNAAWISALDELDTDALEKAVEVLEAICRFVDDL